jgi:hypothetical protein
LYSRILALTCLSLAVPASAIEVADGHLNVSGFGGWQFGLTNQNSYLAGTADSNFKNANAGLNVAGVAADRIKAVVQFSFKEDVDGPHFSFDYGFAEYDVSDAFKIRAGQVKQPFGLSTETFNIGTLRPFLDLPQAVYGASGFVGLAYKGVGITGEVPLGNWSLTYDVYGGGIDLVEYIAPEQYLHGEQVSILTEEYRESTRGLLGGRVNLQTPIEGLRFGASGYGGWEIGSNLRFVAGAHVEYVDDAWLVRAEYAHETVVNDLIQDGAYLEAAYHLTRHWQFAAQGGVLLVSLPGVPNPAVPSFNVHEELALGVNFWVTQGLVFKVAVHRVWGNRFAGPEPETYEGVISSGQLKTTTNLVQAGVQFSF